MGEVIQFPNKQEVKYGDAILFCAECSEENSSTTPVLYVDVTFDTNGMFIDGLTCPYCGKRIEVICGRPVNASE